MAADTKVAYYAAAGADEHQRIARENLVVVGEVLGRKPGRPISWRSTCRKVWP